MNGFFKLGLLAALVTGSLGLAYGQDQDMEIAPTTGRTLVLVIGAGKTPADQSIVPRPFAEKDARELFNLLNDGKHAKIAPGDAKLLLAGGGEGAENATRENTLKALNWLANEAKPGDTAILALFCQGGRQALLLPCRLNLCWPRQKRFG
jgi:hypothetical protein